MKNFPAMKDDCQEILKVLKSRIGHGIRSGHPPDKWGDCRGCMHDAVYFSDINLACFIQIVYNYKNIFLLYDVTLMQAIMLVGKTVTDLGMRIAAVYMIIALADFAYQKWKFKEDMKMSKQEVKEEYIKLLENLFEV